MKDNHKFLKRFLAFVLSVAMVITYMPTWMIAYAEDGQPAAEEVVEEPATTETVETETEEPAPADEPAQADPVTEEPAEEVATPPEGKSPEGTDKPTGENKKAEEAVEEQAADEEKFGEGSLEYKGDDYVVTVSYGADAKIPAGARLEAEEIAQDSDEYRKYYEEAEQAILEERAAYVESADAVSGFR